MKQEEIPPTIISIDHLGVSSTICIENFDVTIQELLGMIKGSLITVGFTECQWENAIIEMADEIDSKYTHTNN